jgi:anaerobic ribonucleoside-triphosphate reductase
MRNWPQARHLVKGDIEADEYYYTNSIHLRANAPVDLLTRIQKQAKFHSLIESGAIIHAFVGENLPSAGAIASLVQKTFDKTRAAQLTVSPEFTICRVCNRANAGLQGTCRSCGATDYFEIARTDATELPLRPWNRDALLELERVKAVAR